MCGSVVDIQCAAADIRRGKKDEDRKRPQDNNLRHVSTIGKNLLSSDMSSTFSHNMVNFGLLAAEIGLPVWGTPVNFNGFLVLAALLHDSQLVSVSQTLQR